jgi:hypothetical protein
MPHPLGLRPSYVKQVALINHKSDRLISPGYWTEIRFDVQPRGHVFLT